MFVYGSNYSLIVATVQRLFLPFIGQILPFVCRLTLHRDYTMISPMDKAQIKKWFGSYNAFSKAAGLHRSSVTHWPDPLPQAVADRVVGVAYRTGKLKPKSK